jgi:hypothetical protein
MLVDHLLGQRSAVGKTIAHGNALNIVLAKEMREVTAVATSQTDGSQRDPFCGGGCAVESQGRRRQNPRRAHHGRGGVRETSSRNQSVRDHRVRLSL